MVGSQSGFVDEICIGTLAERFTRNGGNKNMETVYIAGGCLWGVQHFFDTVPGVQMTEAGRANGTTDSLDGPYAAMQNA